MVGLRRTLSGLDARRSLVDNHNHLRHSSGWCCNSDDYEWTNRRIGFYGFTDYFLVPALRDGDIVVMDNLFSHKVTGIVEMIESVGAQVWYLPPYSPDFNPIKQMWSKVKSCLRAYAARTKKSLLNAIGKALNQVTIEECTNYFQHCGYVAT